MKKSSKVILIIVLILIVVVIGVGGYFVGLKLKESNEKINELENKIANAEQKEENNNVIQNKADENTTNNISTENTNSNIKGLYEYDKVFDDNQNEMGYYLYLYKNGEFRYERSTTSPTGEIGTYTVNGNTIKLNVKYETSSDVVITKTNKTIELTINKDGTISDKNSFFKFDDFNGLDEKYKNFDFGNIILDKASESQESEYLNTHPTIQDLIKSSTVQDKIN